MYVKYIGLSNLLLPLDRMTNWLWLNVSGEKDCLRSLEEVTEIQIVKLVEVYN
jgi:hypothetical protein